MKPGFFAFIILSALVHAAVFGLRDDLLDVTEDIKEQGGSVIHIELAPQIVDQEAPSSQPETQHQKSKTANEAVEKVLTESEPVKKQAQESSTEEPVPPEKVSNDEILTALSSPTKTLLSPIKNNKNKITDLLNTELSKHFYYPKSAIKRHREGKVTLVFNINAKGEINDISIKTSSGHIILDNAAISSVKKIDIRKELKKLLTAKNSHIVLPVLYNLNQ